MSIEQSLDRIAGALETLVAYEAKRWTPAVVTGESLGAGSTVATDGSSPKTATELKSVLPELPGEPIPGVPQPKRGPGRPPKATAPVVVATQPAAAPVVVATPGEPDPFAEDNTGPAVEEKPLTEGDVRLELQALATRLGNTKKVFEIMRAVANAETLPKVKPEFYKRVIAAAKAS